MPVDPQVQLGPCEYISQVSTKENGSYIVDDNTSIPLFPTTNENELLDLKPTADAILKRRPFRFYMHPKHLDSILAGSIQSNRSELLREENIVITWRGILTKIFLGDRVTLHVSYIAGKLLMEEEGPDPKWRARSYDFGAAIGMAFEDLYTTSGSGETAHADHQWGNIVTRSLGDLRLVFCGEVDAVKHVPGTPENTEPDDWYNRRIELKTKTTSISHKAPTGAFLRKWHMQSALLGVPEIFVGWRNKEHKITRTETLQTSNIQPTTYESNIRLGHEVLSSLLREVANDSLATEDTIWKVTIKKWALSGLTRLDEGAAWKVKRRRDRITERVGIVPKDMVSFLRAQ